MTSMLAGIPVKMVPRLKFLKSFSNKELLFSTFFTSTHQEMQGLRLFLVTLLQDTSNLRSRIQDITSSNFFDVYLLRKTNLSSSWHMETSVWFLNCCMIHNQMNIHAVTNNVSYFCLAIFVISLKKLNTQIPNLQ